MYGHVRTLGALHIVFGGVGILCGLLGMLFFGGIAGLVGLTDHSGGKLVAIPILGALAALAMILALVLSLPSLIAGIGLIQLRPWARIVGIILSAIELLHFPFGTALGFYGLWVLLNRGAEQLFAAAPG